MENKYIQKIIANPNPDTLVPIWIPVPGSPGLYQEAYAPKGSFDLGYLRLSFNVTQSGTDAPVPEVNLNEVGAVFTPTYEQEGFYFLNWNLNVTNLNKIERYGGLVNDVNISGIRVLSNRITLESYQGSNSGAPLDGVFNRTSFELRFYPGWDA